MHLNRGKLAKAFGVSEPTSGCFIADHCPVVEKGGNGHAYNFSLEAVKAWRPLRRAGWRRGGADAAPTRQEYDRKPIKLVRCCVLDKCCASLKGS